jgi:hypothetical protein
MELRNPRLPISSNNSARLRVLPAGTCGRIIRKPKGIATMNKHTIAILGEQAEPADAIWKFFSSGVDALMTGSFLVAK